MADNLWNDPELMRVRDEREGRFRRATKRADKRRDRGLPRVWTWRSVFSDVKDICGAGLRVYGLMSRDPYIARISMVEEAQRQIGIQREIQFRQRIEDEARAEARARILARAMVQEMKAEVDRGRRP